MPDKIQRSEAEWRQELGEERYRILRQAGTEAPFTGALLGNKAEGAYVCGACGEPLFDSSSKYDSGSGWPSFTAPADPNAVAEITDHSHGMTRTEVRCAKCEGHLGHVFPDGPGPEGLRYCINSASLDFAPARKDAGTASSEREESR
jgi:peptide-methionine (R)-S-oxide reductase